MIKNDYSFRDYLAEYQANAKRREVQTLVRYLGVDEGLLIGFTNTRVVESDINEYGRFDKLVDSVDKNKAKQYFEGLEGALLKPYKVSIKTDKLLRDFILRGGVLEEDD